MKMNKRANARTNRQNIQKLLEAIAGEETAFASLREGYNAIADDLPLREATIYLHSQQSGPRKKIPEPQKVVLEKLAHGLPKAIKDGSQAVSYIVPGTDNECNILFPFKPRHGGELGRVLQQSVEAVFEDGKTYSLPGGFLAYFIPSAQGRTPELVANYVGHTVKTRLPDGFMPIRFEIKADVDITSLREDRQQHQDIDGIASMYDISKRTARRVVNRLHLQPAQEDGKNVYAPGDVERIGRYIERKKIQPRIKIAEFEDPAKYMTVDMVAEELDMSPMQVRERMAAGEFGKHRKYGSKLYAPTDGVEEFRRTHIRMNMQWYLRKQERA
jgi:hypothetical protein